MSTLIFGLVAGIVGMAYFAYGKRAVRLTPMICGGLLCVYPYFISSMLWLCVVGAVLLVAPFLTDL